MHIPETVLPPATLAATAAVSATALGYATVRVRRELGERVAPLLGVLAACVFAIQMLNFPIAAGVSGHPLGAALTAAVVGPWGGMVVMGVVLAVQALVFQDGGVLALGANLLNVAVIGCAVAYLVMDETRRRIPGRAGLVAGATLAGWLSLFLGAFACAVELATRPDVALSQVLGPMLLLHAIIGVGEALVTGLAVGYLATLRPDLIYQGQPLRRLQRAGQVIAVGLIVALTVAIILAPFASTLPDGLEATMARLSVEPQADEPLIPAPMPDYSLAVFQNAAIGGAIASAVGVLLTFALASILAVRARRLEGPTSHH